jgi:hypothetical protein
MTIWYTYFVAILVYFMTILYILWQFGIFYGYWVYFFRAGMLHQEKSGNPAYTANNVFALGDGTVPTFYKAEPV